MCNLHSNDNDDELDDNNNLLKANQYYDNNNNNNNSEWDERSIILICQSSFVNLTIINHLILAILMSILSILGKMLVYWIELSFYSFYSNIYRIGFGSLNNLNNSGFSSLEGVFETIEDSKDCMLFIKTKLSCLMDGKFFVVLEYISPFLLSLPVAFYYILSH